MACAGDFRLWSRVKLYLATSDFSAEATFQPKWLFSRRDFSADATFQPKRRFQSKRLFSAEATLFSRSESFQPKRLLFYIHCLIIELLIIINYYY